MFSINFTLAIFLLVFFFVFYPAIIMLVFKNKPKVLNIIAQISLIAYFLLLFLLVFGQVSIKENMFCVELIFNNSWFSLNFCVASFSLTNIFYNLIMMFPISAFIIANSFSIFNNKGENKKFIRFMFLKSIIFSFIVSLVIEFFQFVLPVNRTTEILDLILNTLSGVLGFVFFYGVILVYKKLKMKKL